MKSVVTDPSDWIRSCNFAHNKFRPIQKNARKWILVNLYGFPTVTYTRWENFIFFNFDRKCHFLDFLDFHVSATAKPEELFKIGFLALFCIGLNLLCAKLQLLIQSDGSVTVSQSHWSFTLFNSLFYAKIWKVLKIHRRSLAK